MRSADLSPSDATLPREDILRVLESREGLRVVMQGLAARPALDAEEIVRVCAWLASAACGWIDGSLAVAVRAGSSEKTTQVDVFDELGDGVRERLVPAATFAVDPRAVRRLFEMMQPLLKGLLVWSDEDGGLVLRRHATAWEQRETLPPPKEPVQGVFGLVTRVNNVSDRVMGELAELVAKSSETED